MIRGHMTINTGHARAARFAKYWSMRAFCLTVGLFLLLTVPVSAQGPTAMRLPQGRSLVLSRTPMTSSAVLIGGLSTLSGIPLPDARVQVRSLATGRTVGAVQTTSTGTFTFPSLPAGTYLVEYLDSHGGIAAVTHPIMLRAGESVATLLRVTTPAMTAPASSMPWLRLDEVLQTASNLGVTAWRAPEVVVASPLR